MAEESKDIPGVQGIKMRTLSLSEKKRLKDVLWSSTVSDMRTVVMWSIEEPDRFNHFIDRALDGLSFKSALREAEYL